MTRREAKQIACVLSARLLSADSQQDSWLLARLSHLSPADRQKVITAVQDLVDELTRRGKDGHRFTLEDSPS